MEEFFTLCGIVITAIWLAVEASQKVDGWLFPAFVGIVVFVLVSMSVFHNTERIPTGLQGLVFGLITGIGLFRIVVLNTTSDADHLGGFICGLGCFALEWMMLAKMKNNMQQDARDAIFRKR
jgi:hypothetical protein